MSNKIGILSEKSVHSVMKNYICDDVNKHEIKVGKFIADVKIDNNIFEIQTSNFKYLIHKINYYLSNNYNIIVVLPVIHNKIINWIDTETGEILEKRKTSHKGVIQDYFKEIYWIKDYIGNTNFCFKAIHVDVNEYKYLDGYGINNKKRATKIDKIPYNIGCEITINDVNELIKLIPTSLRDKEFSCEEFKKAAKSNSKYFSSGVKMLRELEVIRVIRKERNKYIYSI